ncbi:MAG TPA: single-stranded DNA-binding protein [Candidatus Gastranaerophilales bacterium]|nr:single-stranded DNA-binding protein [Candidatus Gastranaerophilales bacterium]
MINSVVLVGRVGQDPEMKYFESGKAKTTLSIAVNRWTKGGEKTDWFRIELWDKQAEVAGEYVKKGRLVAVEGRLDLNKWKGQDGTEREMFVVIGSNLRLLGGKNESQAE